MEGAYTHRQHVGYLTSEVKRLAPLEGEVQRLKQEEKRLDRLYQDAKVYEEQVVKLVSSVSEKEAEVAELKKQLSSGDHLIRDISEADVNIRAEVAKLKEQLKSKDHEISRLRVLLRVHEKSKTVEGHVEGSSGIAAVQAEFERKLAHKEAMIRNLKKKVVELAEVARQPVPDEEDAATSEDKTDSDVNGQHLSSPEPGAGAAVVGECHQLGGAEDGQKELVEELQRAVEERDKKIHKLTDQLQSLSQTATTVAAVVKHSKDQSGEIVRLKKELEAAEVEVRWLRGNLTVYIM